MAKMSPICGISTKKSEPIWPQFLTIKEKHRNYVYLIKNYDDLFEICLKTLRERFEAGYWYYFDPKLLGTFEEYFLQEVGITVQEAEIFQKMKHNENANLLVTNNKRHYSNRQRENQEYVNIRSAIENKDGKKAWNILSNRSRNEYESVELDSFCNVRE